MRTKDEVVLHNTCKARYVEILRRLFQCGPQFAKASMLPHCSSGQLVVWQFSLELCVAPRRSWITAGGWRALESHGSWDSSGPRAGEHYWLVASVLRVHLPEQTSSLTCFSRWTALNLKRKAFKCSSVFVQDAKWLIINRKGRVLIIKISIFLTKEWP